jgi:predicted Mrr-cat superfamily restriction endonuclease
MKQFSKYIGLDVHKETIAVAVAEGDATTVVAEIGDLTRLCSRDRKLEARGKLKVQVSNAVARELAGFIWAIGQVTPKPSLKA